MTKSLPRALFLGLLLVLVAAGAAKAAEIYVTQWKTNEAGEIEIRQPSGEKTMIKAPELPEGGVVASMTPQGYWAATVGGQRLMFQLKSAAQYQRVGKSECVKSTGLPYKGKQVSGLNDCVIGK